MTEVTSWSSIEPYLTSGTTWIVSLGGSRNARMGYDSAQASLFARLPVRANTVPPETQLADISVRVAHDDTGPVLELRTAERHLFQDFHRFAGLVTEIFEAESDATIAFSIALRRWQEVLSARRLLTSEQQLGLVSELLLLDALTRREGAVALDSWTGRGPAFPHRHDFRLDRADIEVKATRQSVREHMIHGLGQLQPAPDRRLYVLSLRLEPAGQAVGFSLAGLVDRLLHAFAIDPTRLASLEELLRSCGYDHADRGHYSDRFRLADAPRLVSVDDRCPRLTADDLALILRDRSSRVSQVNYSVNLEGLGVDEGSTEYRTVLNDIVLG